MGNWNLIDEKWQICKDYDFVYFESCCNHFYLHMMCGRVPKILMQEACEIKVEETFFHDDKRVAINHKDFK